MTDDQFFLHVYDEVSECSNQSGEYAMLQCSGRLRQLFLDAIPLIHIANRHPRIRLRFKVMTCELPAALWPKWGYLNLLPRGISLSSPKLSALSVDQFLSTTCLIFERKSFSVRDVVKYCANCCGGVHRASADVLQEQIASLDTALQVEGKGIAIRAINDIARVTVHALDPLASALRISPSV
jgi:hypothetical protein